MSSKPRSAIEWEVSKTQPSYSLPELGAQVVITKGPGVEVTWEVHGLDRGERYPIGLRPVLLSAPGIEMRAPSVMEHLEVVSLLGHVGVLSLKMWRGEQLNWLEKVTWAEMTGVDVRVIYRVVCRDGVSNEVLLTAEGRTPYEVLGQLQDVAADPARLVWLGLELARLAWGENLCAPDNPWREAQQWDWKLSAVPIAVTFTPDESSRYVETQREDLRDVMAFEPEGARPTLHGVGGLATPAARANIEDALLLSSEAEANVAVLTAADAATREREAAAVAAEATRRRAADDTVLPIGTDMTIPFTDHHTRDDQGATLEEARMLSDALFGYFDGLDRVSAKHSVIQPGIALTLKHAPALEVARRFRTSKVDP